MAFPIRMPELGTAVSEVRLLKWLVPEQASVNRGDLIAELETDKATFELECVAQGVLLRQCTPAGTSVEPGEIIAYVGQPGEIVEDPGKEETAPLPPPQPSARSERGPKVAPVVANLAARLNVDLANVKGTGARGTITRDDVVHAERARSASVTVLSRMQSAVARAVTKSNAEVPQLRLAATLNMTRVRRLLDQAPEQGRRCFYDAVFVRAIAKALAAAPLMASHLEEQRIVPPEGLHISIAVSSDTDLVLPVMRDADTRSFEALRAGIEALVGRARRGSLELRETTGGCFTLSNLGMYPIDWFEALVFPGQTAILAVGAVQERSVVNNGRIEACPVVSATLAADHRLVNGRTAAEFLTKLKEIVEAGSLESRL